MANTIIEFDYLPGRTLTGRLYEYGNDTAASTSKTATEETNRKGKYRITVSEALTGIHELRISEGGTFVAKYPTDTLVDDTNIYQADDRFIALANGVSSSLVDLTWDEIITGAQHNVNGSAAKFLREASEAITGVTGTLQSATSTTAVLASGAVAANDIFNGERLAIIEGTGAGQSRLIVDSVASTDTVTLVRAWVTTPDNTSVYAITGGEVEVQSIEDGLITSAKFTVSTISGVASGILEKIDQLWRRFFKKSTKDATDIKTYADDGTTVLTTQAWSSSGDDDEVGAAS